MHILFANNYHYLRGGSERVMFDEMAQLRAEGHCVSVFSRNHPDTIQSDDSDYFVSFKDMNTCGTLDKILWATTPIFNYEAKRGMKRMLKEKKPDLVHAHNIYNGLSTSILSAARAEGIPSVLTLHDYKLVCPSYVMVNHGEICEKCMGGRFRHCLRNRCAKGGALGSVLFTIESYYNLWLKKYLIPGFLISPSQFLKDKVIAGGYPEERIKHIVNAVDMQQYEPNTTPGDYALYIGRLSHEKGIHTLLAAFHDIDVPLRIVGTGPEQIHVERYVEEHGLKHIRIEGYKKGSELRQLCRECAFSIIPSEWYENCPMSVIEMMAYGKPVIGSRVGGIPELIDDQQSGFLFDMGNEDQLREFATTLWNNRAKIESMGKYGREKAEREYSLETHKQRLLTVYESAINHNNL